MRQAHLLGYEPGVCSIKGCPEVELNREGLPWIAWNGARVRARARARVRVKVGVRVRMA